MHIHVYIYIYIHVHVGICLRMCKHTYVHTNAPRAYTAQTVLRSLTNIVYTYIYIYVYVRESRV